MYVCLHTYIYIYIYTLRRHFCQRLSLHEQVPFFLLAQKLGSLVCLCSCDILSQVLFSDALSAHFSQKLPVVALLFSGVRVKSEGHPQFVCAPPTSFLRCSFLLLFRLTFLKSFLLLHSCFQEFGPRLKDIHLAAHFSQSDSVVTLLFSGVDIKSADDP